MNDENILLKNQIKLIEDRFREMYKIMRDENNELKNNIISLQDELLKSNQKICELQSQIEKNTEQETIPLKEDINKDKPRLVEKNGMDRLISEKHGNGPTILDEKDTSIVPISKLVVKFNGHLSDEDIVETNEFNRLIDKKINIKDFWDAAEKGSLEDLKRFYNEDCTIINKKSENKFYDDWTALHYASDEGHLECVRFLLSQGAEVDPMDCEKRTPLLKASARGHLAIVELLLDNGAEVNHQDMDRDTPLHCAIPGNHLPVIRTLITRGADYRMKNKWNKTPLESAKYLKINLSTVEKFLKLNHNIDKSENLKITNSEEEIRTNGSLSDDDGSRKVISEKIKTNDAILDEIITTHGAFAEEYEILETISEKDEIAEGSSAEKIDEEIAEINEEEDSIKDIWDAAGKGSLEDLVGFYREDPLIINQKSENNDWTVLHYAANGGHLECVSFLLTEGAEVNPIDSENKTPLLMASERGAVPVVNLLLDKGADVNHQDANGDTALHWAVRANHLQVINLLITNGADNKITNKLKQTPYDLAKLLKLKRVGIFLYFKSEKNEDSLINLYS